MVTGTSEGQGLSEEDRALVAAALEARSRAYAPYSKFAVGAAVRTASGRIFTGCNVENAAFGLTVCAERVAIWKAVSAGERALVGLAVVSEGGVTPCGACRQVMSEFVEDMSILVADTENHVWATSLQALLPDAFPRVSVKDKRCSCPGHA
ncbi:MAG: cytidine deaminase [Chloroflexota bacterium]|nr:cytidine deaminase [Chloroflexota bacterium]